MHSTLPRCAVVVGVVVDVVVGVVVTVVVGVVVGVAVAVLVGVDVRVVVGDVVGVVNPQSTNPPDATMALRRPTTSAASAQLVLTTTPLEQVNPGTDSSCVNSRRAVVRAWLLSVLEHATGRKLSSSTASLCNGPHESSAVATHRSATVVKRSS